MKYIQYNFFVGKINKIEASIICVDNVCTVFLNRNCSNNTSNTIDKTILQELELLKKRLEKCADKNSNIILNSNATLDSNTINHPIKQKQTNEIKTQISSDKINTTNTSKVNIKTNTSKVSVKKR